jgi:hypothetical protein
MQQMQSRRQKAEGTEGARHVRFAAREPSSTK